MTKSQLVDSLLANSHEVVTDTASLDTTYPDYADYADHSDGHGWGDAWNDGPSHSDSWSDGPNDS